MNTYQACKRAGDVTASILLLVATSPIVIITGLLIAIIDGFPIIYSQRRLGVGKQLFTIYKFRTMHEGGETAIAHNYVTTINDARVTWLGGLLRRSSIDELPQLLNVLMGDMSIVGPRPAVHDELGDTSKFNSKLNRRFTLKPGITGYAQVKGRNQLTWDEKIELDNKYIDMVCRNGMATDLTIILRTIIVVLNGLLNAKGIFERLSDSSHGETNAKNH